jgi:hypothetical protein
MLNLEKDSYSKDEVIELFKPFETEITDLKNNVIEGNKAIEKVKELEKDNLINNIKLEMAKVGLDADTMFDLVEANSIEKAQAKITKLAELKKQNKIDNSFRPEDHKQTDEYSNAEKQGDVQGMLKSKISKLFQ